MHAFPFILVKPHLIRAGHLKCRESHLQQTLVKTALDHCITAQPTSLLSVMSAHFSNVLLMVHLHDTWCVAAARGSETPETPSGPVKKDVFGTWLTLLTQLCPHSLCQSGAQLHCLHHNVAAFQLLLLLLLNSNYSNTTARTIALVQ